MESFNKDNFQFLKVYTQSLDYPTVSGAEHLKLLMIREQLAEIETELNTNESEHCNYQYIVLEIDEKRTKISRDTLVELLNAENIVARRYFYPGCHRMEPYRSYFPHAGLLLPETEQLTQRVMLLPTGTAMDRETISKVCDMVRYIVQNAHQINRGLVKYSSREVEKAVKIVTEFPSE